MHPLRKFLGTLLSIGFIAIGLFMIFRELFPGSQVFTEQTRLTNISIEALERNRNTNYAILFDVANSTARHGISLGTEVDKSEEQLFDLLDSSVLYTVRFNLGVTSVDGIFLDVRSIEHNNQLVYKASIMATILSGILICIFGFVLFYFGLLKRRDGNMQTVEKIWHEHT